jgi:hypothetical protein
MDDRDDWEFECGWVFWDFGDDWDKYICWDDWDRTGDRILETEEMNKRVGMKEIVK